LIGKVMRSLYLCYFGLREPLVQTQVLPYLRSLSEAGIDISLLTFEPDRRRAWTQEEIDTWRRRLRTDGIGWFSLPYHKRPSLPATLYDIAAGAWRVSRLIRRYQIDVIHARTHIPVAMALLAQKTTGCRLIFDIRGLIAEEYVDAGIWIEGSPTFRAIKRLERAGIQRADQVIVLTRRMREWLIEEGLASANKIEVIPCCVDLSRFADADNIKPGSERFEVIYAGSVTGLYLLEEMARFFLVVQTRQPTAFFRILTASSPEAASSVLRRAGLKDNDFWIGAVDPAEVPGYLGRARLGISFRKPTFSQIAASPTKIPEYLAAGLPVISNAGTGDVDDLLEGERVGVSITDFTQKAYAEAADKALELVAEPALRSRCKRVARERFDLRRVGASGYLRVYGRIEEQISAERSFVAVS
jgi:glycosyltransferase involved in cell wall biosynthesis